MKKYYAFIFLLILIIFNCYTNRSNVIPSDTNQEVGYSSNNIKTNKQIITIGNEEKRKIYISYKYNKQGKKSEAVYSDINNIQISKIIYEYNQAGNISQEIHYNSHNILKLKKIYKYNNSDILKVSEQKVYNVRGDLLFRMIYYYDNSGNILKEEAYNSNKKLVFTETF